MDIRVLNPHTTSNRQFQPATSYRRHEILKKRDEQCIQDIEHSSFTPLVVSITGGLGCLANTMYKCLASMLSSKWDQSYSTTMGWLRCRLLFSLLCTSILSIRGARSASGNFVRSSHLPVDLMTVESQVSTLH